MLNFIRNVFSSRRTSTYRFKAVRLTQEQADQLGAFWNSAAHMLGAPPGYQKKAPRTTYPQRNPLNLGNSVGGIYAAIR
jgi:hypothetical protein